MKSPGTIGEKIATGLAVLLFSPFLAFFVLLLIPTPAAWKFVSESDWSVGPAFYLWIGIIAIINIPAHIWVWRKR